MAPVVGSGSCPACMAFVPKRMVKFFRNLHLSAHKQAELFTRSFQYT